jgi:hypothetical protein
MNQKKLLWIAGRVLLMLVICGLLVWLSSGIVEMARAHLGM